MVVLIRDAVAVQQKIAQLRQSGCNNLHLLADFDKTITTTFAHGKKIQSTNALLRNNKYLGPEFVAEDQQLFDYYYPLEKDPLLPAAERNVKMEEWWRKHFELLRKYKLHQKMIYDIVDRDFLQLRRGATGFFKILSKNNIPLLILSAGLGDIIKLFMIKHKVSTPNIHIISNFYTYDNNGFLLEHLGQFIHACNKSEVIVKGTPYYSEIQQRKNIILLGDSLDDLGMSAGIPHDIILRIGFFNEGRPTPEFLEKFDITITEDGTFEYVNQVLKMISR